MADPITLEDIYRLFQTSQVPARAMGYPAERGNGGDCLRRDIQANGLVAGENYIVAPNAFKVWS
jgi:hypothetical protein